MTDARQIGLALLSETYEPIRGAADKAGLVIVCNYGGDDPPRWAALINWGRYVDNENIVPISIRFGSEPAQRRPAGLSADHTASILFRSGVRLTDLIFMTELQRHSRFAAQVRRHDGTTITATWDVTGLTAALAPLREHCQ